MEGEGALFGERMLEYWKGLGLQDHWDDLALGTMPKQELATGEVIYWGRADRSGRNRFGLMVLVLAWWGQAIWNNGVGDGIGGGEAALAAAADWNFMVEDLVWVLGFLADYEDWPGCKAELAVKRVLGETGAERQEKVNTKGKGNGKGKGKTMPNADEEPKKRKASDEVPPLPAKAQRTTRGRKAAEPLVEDPPRQEIPKARPRPRPLVKKVVENASLPGASVDSILVGADGATANNAEEMEVDDNRGTEDKANEEDRPGDVSVGNHAAESIYPCAENCTATNGDHENTPNAEEAKNTETPQDSEEDHPFARLMAEELAEIAMDRSADEDDEEGDS
ncbi:hypothetical protein B0H13DRAFT_2338511 [Mycena leptocephala]|nr:hypothetical protein B0H13DRAFT_2338511 [Mycena leptocephala]